MDKKTLVIAGIVLVIIVAGIGIFRHKSANVDGNPASNISAQKWHEQAIALAKDRDLLKAKEAYQRIISDYPDYEKIDSAQKELEALNMQIIFSNTPVPKSVIHEVKVGDSLGKLSKQYGTTMDLIRISNHLTGDVIRPGQKLRIWTSPFNIFVDKSQNILIVKDGEEVVKIYNVSTGVNNSTPVGHFKITSKLVDPVWFNKGAVVPPESPQNVLGSRWMGFDLPGYGIHGTVDPQNIGKQVTAGCVRMRNEEVEELFGLIPLGTQVTIVD